MRVALVAPANGADTDAITDWLRAEDGLQFEMIQPNAACDVEADVLWVHRDRAALPPALEPPRSVAGLLLTGGAARLPHQWGWEPIAPNDTTDRVWRDADDGLVQPREFADTPRVRGHAGFREHPVFLGLYGGTYTWCPHEGESFSTITYCDGAWPECARVIAVERACTHLTPTRPTIWEYATPTQGVALCIGAYLPFAASDAIFRPCLSALMRNVLSYCARPVRSKGCHWPRPGSASIRRDPALALPAAQVLDADVELHAAMPSHSGAPDADATITLAGERAFAAGSELQGIREVWVHPTRIMKDLTSSVRSPCTHVQVTPVCFERTFAVGLRERVLVARELPAVVWSWSAREPCELALDWVVDLRFMWPFPDGVLGSLRWNLAGQALVVAADDPRDTVCFQTSQSVDWEIAESAEAAPAIAIRLQVSLAAGETFTIAAVGGTPPPVPVPSFASLARGRAAHSGRRRQQLLRVVAPDPRVEAALAWADHRLDSAMANTPGVGRSLVGGYAASTPGWGDGRPGCAWYFGPDAVWTALALLALGDFDAVRAVIAFLGSKLDPRGKVLHECTTSGSAHYDAADSTPLYLLLVARYHAASGDLAFVRAEWPHLRAALDYCRSTDSLGEDLIENSRGGHGLIERGPRGGASVTFYNAGVRAAALRELALTAEAIGERADCDRLRAEATRARSSLPQTANHAVPLLLGVIEPEGMSRWLDLVAGGAAGPFDAGWISWAEYTAGRTGSGFRHWCQCVLLFEPEKGVRAEVRHGARNRPACVCPDQAWSAAMAVAPMAYGMLGFEPDAAKHRARLRPAIPHEWDALEVHNLRVGDGTFSLTFARTDAVHSFRLSPTSGPVPLRLVFEPTVTARQISSVSIDGVSASLDTRPWGDRLLCPLQIVLDHVREVVIQTVLP